FHYRSYGTFFYTQKSSIISMVDLPTTDIIEPFFGTLFSKLHKINHPFSRVVMTSRYPLSLW
ncbi:hypothetical protein F6P71_08975, partial [Streptococcus suis]|nr:hypothetical protein [Streptococcus suis]